MCFRYALTDTAYLKDNVDDMRIGDRVSIIGRYEKDGVNWYKIINTDTLKSTKRCSVCESKLSNRPPYEELYCIRTDLHNYRHKYEDRKDFDYVVGNIETAVLKFNAAVGAMQKLREREKDLYGKVTLYYAEINEDGSICECAYDNNIIKQKFFLGRD